MILMTDVGVNISFLANSGSERGVSPVSLLGVQARAEGEGGRRGGGWKGRGRRGRGGSGRGGYRGQTVLVSEGGG